MKKLSNSIAQAFGRRESIDTGSSPYLGQEQIQQMIDPAIAAKAAGIDRLIDERVSRAVAQRLFIPRLPAMNNDGARPFMPYSNCSTADMLHPRYRELCSLILSPPVFHRKMWEWIFVMHHLFEARVIARGNRGICFGVGSESLPALFAGHGATITATDAPPEVIESSVWTESGQHAASRDSLRNQQLCPNDQFDDLVTFRYCDINAIDVELSDFDFAWSSCCFEHLGSIEAGMQFVINCVEKCLKPGGLQPATRPHRTSLEAGPAPRDAQSLLRYTPRGPGSRRRLLRSLAKTQSGVAKTMLHYLGRCV